MGFPGVCLCVGAILFITGLDAKSLKLVPTETKTIHINGATHEISRYIVVPDDGASNDTSNDTTDKKTLETLNDVKYDVINGDHVLKHNISPKPADTEDSKLNETTTKGEDLKKFKDKYYLVNVVHPEADINETVKLDKSAKAFEGYSNSGAEVETNETAKSVFKETAGDHKNFGHFKTKTITKTIYHPTKVINVKFNELPIKWDDNEKGLYPSSIPINKTFTLPGKRGRFKLLYEDDEDTDTVIEHSTAYPKTHTKTRYYVDDSGKIIPNVVNTDSSFRSVTIKTKGQGSEPKPTVLKTYLSTNNEKEAVEKTPEKYNLRSSPPSHGFIEVNIGDTKSHADSSININNGAQKLTNDTNLVNISVQKGRKESTPQKTLTVSSFVSKSDIEQVEPKVTNILVTKPASKIDNIDAIPPNDDHANTNADGTHFSSNRFEFVSTQENSETLPQIRNKYVDEKLNAQKILKFSKSSESKDELEVIPLKFKISEINHFSPNERVDSPILPTSKTSKTKTSNLITNGIKQNEPLSDISLQENNLKLVSLINKFENTMKQKDNITSNPHEVSSTPDKVNIFSIKNSNVNVPTMESQTNTFELTPTVNTSSIITTVVTKQTKEKPSTDGTINIILSKDQKKMTTPKIESPINDNEIIPAVDRTTVDKNYENQNKVPSTENLNELPVNSDPLNHDIVITPKIDKTYAKTIIMTEYINQHENKTVIVPTEKETNYGSSSTVENEVPTKTDVKPKQNHSSALNYFGTKHGNNHEIETKDTNMIYFSGKENLRTSGILPIHQNVVQTTDSPNSKYELTIVAEVTDAEKNKMTASKTENNQTLSQDKSKMIKTETNNDNESKFNVDSSNRSGSENNKNRNGEPLTDHTNILTLLQNEEIQIVPSLKHTDTFTNTLPETNTEITPLETTQDEIKPHVHYHEIIYKENNPTNENETSMPDNKENINFRLGKHHTNLLPTNSTEEIDDLVSSFKTSDGDSNDFDEHNSEDMEYSKAEEYPYEEEESRSSRIINREDSTENEAKESDKNINLAFVGNINDQPIETPHLINLYYNAANNYPLHTIGYDPLHPYQVFSGYHTHVNNPNYENLQFRNAQVENDKYLQYILNYLISNNLIAEINAKYASAGQGVDINEIIMQTILAYLQKLGINNQIGQEQLQFLTQQIQQNEIINVQKKNKHNVEIIYETDDQPTATYLPNQMAPNQYHLVAYANNAHMTGVPTNLNIRSLQDEAYLQRYLLEGFDVKTANFAAVGNLCSRILKYISYLRNLRVPHYQILQLVAEVKKHLTMEALQTFMTECQSRAYVGLAQRIDSVLNQFLQNYMRKRYPIQCN